MKQQNVHASQAEIDAWKKAAQLADLSFNGWARRAMTRVAEVELALERERIRHERADAV